MKGMNSSGPLTQSDKLQRLRIKDEDYQKTQDKISQK